MNEPVVLRYKKNPILTKKDIPYPVSTVHNAGIAQYDGKVVMVFRSHEHNGRSILGIAESDDGFSFSVRATPFMRPAADGIFSEYEEYGVEDPRISQIDDEYFITYSAYSRHGVRIGLAKTKDFTDIERISFITQPDMRNVVIFPERFDGMYVRLDRPHTEISPWPICISYSPDLIHWGSSRVIMKPALYHWDEMKIGPGATPIKTEDGWLHIYHGVFSTMDGSVYRLGAALHELDDPSKLIGISDKWILEPEDPWERVGYVHNVVFSCGALKRDDEILLYWGGADSVMCVGTASSRRLISMCKTDTRRAM